MARNSAAIGVGSGEIKVTLDTVVTGNASGAYSTSTGRYTPPAGRFYISFTPGVMGSSTGASVAITILRKNGVQVAIAEQVPGTAGWFGDPAVHGIFDCNGTDYFEVFAQSNQANCIIDTASALFLAFPILAPVPGTLARITVSASAPSSPVVNDLWVDTT